MVLIKRFLTAMLTLLIFLMGTIVSFGLNTSAKSAVLIEAESGQVIFENNAYQRLPMASTTKIMTAIVAIENCDLHRNITITEEMVGAEGSSIYLKVGEKLTLEQLLYALMLESANDAAEAIAVSIGGSLERFSEMMNDRVAKLGLKDTSFVNPHGLDADGHYTTASDLAAITAYALKNEVFAKIVSTNEYVIIENEYSPRRYLNNHNKLLRIFDGTIGVKTGYTKACGRCLVSAAERNGVRLIAVTLSAPDDWNDHMNMLNYGFDQLENVLLASPGTIKIELPVLCGESNVVTVTNKSKLSVVLKKDHSDIKVSICSKFGKYLFAPIDIDEYVADAIFYADGKEIAKIPLYTDFDVTGLSSKSLFDHFDF